MLKKRKTRIKQCCNSIDNAFLCLFNQFQKYSVLYHFPLSTIVSIIHYSLPRSKVISNNIWGWWLLIGFSFFRCIVSRLFTLYILIFWFLYKCKKKILKLFLLWVLYTILNSIVYIFPVREDLCRYCTWKLILCMRSPTYPWREVIYDNVFR